MIQSVPSLKEMRTVRASFVRDVIAGVEFFEIQRLKCGAVQKATESRRREDAGLCRGIDACKCGDRGLCLFTKDLKKVSAKMQLDGALTKAFMAFLMSRKGLLLKVFEAFYGTCERVLHAYADVKGLTYGKDVMIVLKGGNVFRMTFETALSKLGVPSDGRWDPLLDIGDLDFEVHLSDATADKIREVMRIMAVVMISVREWLLENLPDWPLKAEDVAFGDVVSAGSEPHVRTNVTQTDSVVVPTESEPTCPGCDTVYMSVPSVVKAVQKSGQRAWLFGKTHRGGRSCYPITFNLTLRRNAVGQTDAEVLRIRRSVQIGTNRCARIAVAEVFDLAIAGNMDIKHRLMAEDPASPWFEKVKLENGREIWMLSPHSFFVDTYITLFETNDRPWNAIKYHKRLARWVWVAAVLALSSGLKVPQVCRQLTNAAAGKSPGRIQGAEYIQQIRTLVDRLKVGQDEAESYKEFRELIADCMRHVAGTLSTAKHDGLLYADLRRCNLVPIAASRK
jgi:hypothetical protein